MPDWKAEIRGRLASLRLSPAREEEIVKELTQHLEDRYTELLSGGAAPAEAYRATFTELSSSELLAKELRRVERSAPQEPIVLGSTWRGNMFGGLWQDLRFAIRTLSKNPGFTAVAMLTLCLGIGANTAIFSLTRGVLLRPLPFSEPDRLIGIRESKVGEGHNNPMAWRSFAEFRDKAQTLESIAAYTNWNPDIEQSDGAMRAQGARVSYSYFKVLGVKSLLGRDFTPEDDKVGAPPTAMLGHDLWRQLYGGDREIIGKSLRIDGQSFTIIGVAPPVSL